MISNSRQQLEKAKVYCYEGRILEAYGILRRYFDRLAFDTEGVHSDYIGVFVRVCLELGKKHELEFYTRRLETFYRQSGDPAAAYQ